MSEQRPQNVHEYTTEHGKTYWGVGVWDQNAGQYTCPLDAETRKLTGCYAEFARKISTLGGYATKAQAARRARTLYGYVRSR